MTNLPCISFFNIAPSDIPMKFVVIAARYTGRWVLVRHKERSTYEIPGGHIEDGEDHFSAAKRELYEETGATDFTLDLVSAYTVMAKGETTGGYLFFADVNEVSKLPDYEIAEVGLFDKLPAHLTYPYIQPPLFDRIQGWLNLQSAKDEIWDIYDKNRNLTGRTQRRGGPLAKGDYHLVVYVWILNSKGEFLITKRSWNKGYPHMWECTGGSAVTGDDSLTAAIREVKEETGLDILPENGKCALTLQREDNFCDIWLFRQDFNIDDVVLQENETCDVKWADKDEIRRMTDSGDFFPFCYMDELFEKI